MSLLAQMKAKRAAAASSAAARTAAAAPSPQPSSGTGTAAARKASSSNTAQPVPQLSEHAHGPRAPLAPAPVSGGTRSFKSMFPEVARRLKADPSSGAAGSGSGTSAAAPAGPMTALQRVRAMREQKAKKAGASGGSTVPLVVEVSDAPGNANPGKSDAGDFDPGMPSETEQAPASILRPNSTRIAAAEHPRNALYDAAGGIGLSAATPVRCPVRAARYQTSGGASTPRRVIHLELDLSGTTLEGRYSPGDAVGVLCRNEKATVESLCQRLGYEPDARVLLRGVLLGDGTRRQPLPEHLKRAGLRPRVSDLLSLSVDLATPPRKQVIRLLAAHCAVTG